MEWLDAGALFPLAMFVPHLIAGLIYGSQHLGASVPQAEEETAMFHRRTLLKLAGWPAIQWDISMSHRWLGGLAALLASRATREATPAESARSQAGPFRLAVDTTMFHRPKAPEAFAMIHRAGYRLVELGSPHLRSTEMSGDDLKNLQKQLADAGLVAVTAFIVHSMSSPDEQHRQQAVVQWQKSIDASAHLGLKLVTTELTGELARPKESEAAFRKSMDVLLPRFEQAGIVLSVEPHPGDFYEAARPTLKLLRSYGSKYLTYLHCIPHTFFLGPSIREVIREAGSLITHVHVADTYRTERIMARSGVGLHLHLRPGLGEVDFRETFDALAAVGYRGAVSVQLLSHVDQPEQTARQAREFLQKLLGNRLVN
jgi:myo-inositol catabolism protein IolH